MDPDVPSEEQRTTSKSGKKNSKRNAPDGSHQPRKRTKTGCLTCRKRRIKCGEERPMCLNCHKSRRDCEGYRPPIVFRRSQLHSGQPGVSLAPHSDLNDPYSGNFASEFGSLGQEGLPGWSTVPSAWATSAGQGHSAAFSTAALHPQQQNESAMSAQLAFNAFTCAAEFEQNPAPFFDADLWQVPSVGDAGKPPYEPHSQSSHDHTPGITPMSQDETLSLFHETVMDPALYGHDPYRPVNQNDQDLPHASSTDYPPASTLGDGNSVQTAPSLVPVQFQTLDWATQGSLNLNNTIDSSRAWSPSDPTSAHIKGVQRSGGEFQVQKPNRGPLRSGFGYPGPSQILDAAAVPVQDDDYWDLLSDQDETGSDGGVQFDAISLDRDYDTITALTRSSMALAISNLTNADAYTYPGFSLDAYRPEFTANPLRNPYTQRVFAHFVFSTGPLISYLQQRNRISLVHSSVPGAISGSHQGLWTYTLATMALHNQGLLHAMLAMSSLHMAKLQGASSTPSLKHYSYSLRRVHSDVQHDRKRHEVATLAATLLLAFYEIMQADHRKWSTHLVGAKQLVSEIDFAGLTAQVQHQKARSRSHADVQAAVNAEKDAGIHHPYNEQQTKAYTVDELFPDSDARLVGKLMGKRCARDDQGRFVKDWYRPEGGKELSPSELRSFQILQDLFWWTCRHDIIHGLVGGNALLLDYDRWGDCQPRAPAGQADAVHGSFDHFMLLMGRLVKFISADRSRKIRQSKLAAKASQQAATRARQSGEAPPNVPLHPPPNGPGFFGLAPSLGPGTMPSAFEKPGTQTDTTTEDPSEVGTPDDADIELASATAMALNEWNDIFSAFTAFADALGPGFQPLADDEHAPFSTPFGAAVMFKSHAIAALWAWYYAGLIIALRSHPKMPAPATIAIGYAAQQTAKYANQVGRIVYCITSDFLTPPLDPSSAGAFAEASLPLFFAAVQYQDPEQRRWTVARLHEIENLTGWATIGICAQGCESAWVKAHEMGRGPAYVRSTGIERGEGSVSVMDEAEEDKSPTGEATAAAESSTRNGSSSKSGMGRGGVQAKLERRFSSFYRGTQVMWAYQLFNTSLEDDIACRPHGRAYEA